LLILYHPGTNYVCDVRSKVKAPPSLVLIYSFNIVLVAKLLQRIVGVDDLIDSK